METLTQASTQWSSRPDDERFTSLTELEKFTHDQMQHSRGTVVPSRSVKAAPVDGEAAGLVVLGPDGAPVVPTNWAFGQLATRAGAPAAYLRGLPAPLAADCINYGLAARPVDDLGVLLRRDPETNIATLAAVTGPNYGRVWNAQIAKALTKRFGDGITGDFRVPGEFGKAVEVTKKNTTIYASDRDMFVFLADEEHRIEIPNRRDGEPGSLARGFFVWNSEMGKTKLGIATFLFDYVCQNRTVWGAEGYEEFSIRHTSSAPERWISDVVPAIAKYAESSASSVVDAVKAAQNQKIGDNEAVQKFLVERFTKSQAVAIQAAHLADEGRPIESLWDAATGVTAYARGIPFQDERVDLEREGGKIMKLAA